MSLLRSWSLCLLKEVGAFSVAYFFVLASTAPFAYNTTAAGSIVAEDLVRVWRFVSFLLVLFAGAIPPEFGGLSALEKLDLRFDKLSGKQD